jgi:hypothetical protein
MHHGAAHWAAVRTGMAVRRAQPQLALTIRCEAFRELDAMKRILSLLWHELKDVAGRAEHSQVEGWPGRAVGVLGLS